MTPTELEAVERRAKEAGGRGERSTYFGEKEQLARDVLALVALVRKLEAEQDDVARRLIIMETTPHD